MKIVVIDAREIQSSTGRYMYNLVKQLHLNPHEGMQFKVVVNSLERLEELQELGVDFVKSPYRKFTLGEQIGFRRQLKKLKPDLVHFTMVQQPVLYWGKTVTSMLDLTAIKFKDPLQSPIVFKIRQYVYGLVNKIAARKSKAVICISEYAKGEVAEYTGVNPNKITVTYNAADKITERPVPIRSLENREFIMYVGRPQPHKNLARLLEAFEILQKDHPELWLVLAGKKDRLYEMHEQLVKQKGLKNVIFTGFVSEGELRWLYENTACYVFPSLSEGFGLPGLEAMAHGAPVASSDATCLPEVYSDAAAYFHPEDPKHMAMVVDDIITSPDYANKLRTRGEKRVICFSWKTMAKQTFVVYQQVLDIDKK